MGDNFASFSQIEAEPVRRISSGLSEIDWLYGYSQDSNDIKWGLPLKKISMWAGGKGVGKSRLAILLSKALNSQGWKILYFQTETTLGDLKAWIKSVPRPDLFFCSACSSIEEQISVIRKVVPQFVFVDSINEMEEFSTGQKKEAKVVVNEYYRPVCNEIGCHVIFLTQLNTDGSTKGGSTLPHLVDICFEMINTNSVPDGNFVFKTGSKHRYGRTGPAFQSEWIHGDDGVVCTSDSSAEDEVWCRSHGIQVRIGPKIPVADGTSEVPEQYVRIINSLSLGQYLRLKKMWDTSYPERNLWYLHTVEGYTWEEVVRIARGEMGVRKKGGFLKQLFRF